MERFLKNCDSKNKFLPVDWGQPLSGEVLRWTRNKTGLKMPGRGSLSSAGQEQSMATQITAKSLNGKPSLPIDHPTEALLSH